ncbi:MAG: phosphotransferase, partial [Candidatus Promineifilaceae bacterium]
MIEAIVDKIVPGAKVLRHWPLKGGMSAEMTAVEIAFEEGEVRKLVVRRPSSETEFQTLKLVEAMGLAVPRPYLLEGSDLVMDYVEGEIAFAPTNVDSYLRQMAEQLARIHSVPISPGDLPLLKWQNGVCLELG